MLPCTRYAETSTWIRPATTCPKDLCLRAGRQRILVTHILEDADVAGFDLVVCGHSHMPKISTLESVVLPEVRAASGPRRFRLPVSMGYITLSPDGALCSGTADRWDRVGLRRELSDWASGPRLLPPPHQPSPTLRQAQGTARLLRLPLKGGVIRLCCRSGRTECETLGHDSMPQKMLRRPGGFLCMTVYANN